jgi:hypothetical protein
MRLLIRGLNENILEIQDEKLTTFYELQKYLGSEISFCVNGVNQKLNDLLPSSLTIIDAHEILNGGKGGFGSLLKGQPPTKKRTKNFDACRDLTGRRMRHVNQEKMLKEWQQKKLEEEKLMREYSDPKEEENLKLYKDNEKKKEVLRLNEKYLIDSVDTSDSISKSIKFLLKKQKREDEDINNTNKYNNIEIRKMNNIEFKKPKKISLEILECDEKILEEELFKID